MSCSGCIDVTVYVMDSAGVVLGPLPGIMAEGGCLSLKQALQPAPGETVRIENSRKAEAWNAKSFSPSRSKRKNNDRYKYHVQLVSVKSTRVM